MEGQQGGSMNFVKENIEKTKEESRIGKTFWPRPCSVCQNLSEIGYRIIEGGIICDLCPACHEKYDMLNKTNSLTDFIHRERSKREDSCKECSEKGHEWLRVPLSDYKNCERCGALNTMET